MKLLLNYLWKSIVGGVVYIIATMIPTFIWPLKSELTTNIPVDELWFQLPSLLIMGMIFTAVMLFFIRNSRLSGSRLYLLLTLGFYGTVTFMSQIESFYFIEAFPLMDSTTLIQLFTHPFFTTLIFMIFLVFVQKPNEYSTKDLDMNVISIPLVILLSPLYVGVYFFFGQYVAYQSETLQEFYIGWTVAPQLAENLPYFQVFRGFLWIGLSWLLVSQFRSKRDAVIGLSIFYAISLSIQLLSPNPFMPKEVRLFHGMELFSSMLVYGFISGMVLTGYWKLSKLKVRLKN